MQSSAASRRSSEEVRALEAKLDRLALVTRALWEIVRDRTTVSETMLEAKVKEIDQRDGKSDGKAGAKVSSCHNCGRVIQKGQTKCQYCGAEQGFSSVFDWVR